MTVVAHTSFKDLPATYSLPLKIQHKHFGTFADKPAITTITATYDKQGRILSQKDSYGRLTKINYCPLQGDTACPAVPDDWPFSSFVESVTIYPAKISTTTSSPFTMRNYYKKEINHTGQNYTLVLDHQIRQAGQQYIMMTYRYYHNPDNLFTWGLLKQTVLTGNIAERYSPHSIVHDYYYIRSADGQRKISYAATELEGGKRQLSPFIITSLSTNRILAQINPQKTDVTRYYYDTWGRIIEKELSAGTPFARKIHYQYTTSFKQNQIITTAPDGMQHKAVFDGMGRLLMDFDEAIDVNGQLQPGHWWRKQKIIYDPHGRPAVQLTRIFQSTGNIKDLSIHRDYDDSGHIVRTHLPDGETVFTLYDDALRCVVSYRQNSTGKRSALAVSITNVLNKPLKQWILPATNTPLPAMKTLCLHSSQQMQAKVHAFTYDDFGRQITSHDALHHTVVYQYNAFGQLTDIIDPEENRTHKVYNLNNQVIQIWFFPVTGGKWLLSSVHYNAAGQRLWSAGEDGKRTFFTYTLNGQLKSLTTPINHNISWQYNAVGLPVNEAVDNKQQWNADYDFSTTRLIKKNDITGTTTYTYSADGLQKQLIHTANNSYPDYTLHWKYDNNRRIIVDTDISGNKSKVNYDTTGRIISAYYQTNKAKEGKTTLYSIVYDGFSRIRTVTYGDGLQRIISYDSFGRQNRVVDRQDNHLISLWRFNYDAEGNITTLYQKTAHNQYALLSYHYDALNNLTTMTCKGSAGLPLCPHDTDFAGSGLKQAPVITRQQYIFTPLNQLSSVRETLQTAQRHTFIKTVNYNYTDPSAPLRIQTISTVWNQHSPVIHRFTYDIMGNMVTDGQGFYMTYNAFNQIIKVTTPAGKQSYYAYDGNGRTFMEKNAAGVRYLIYHGSHLINERVNSSGQITHIIGYQGIARTMDGIIDEYYERNYKGDVTSVFRKGHNNKYRLSQRNVYSPYGMQWQHHFTNTLLDYQQSLTGFNSERTDPVTGWHFLGAGHRAYNPQMRYFVSEDPAGNGYCFGNNNPIMNTDPDGNMPGWLGETLKWAGYISTAGLGALHQKWVNVAAAAISAGLTIVSTGISLLSYAITTPTVVLASTAMAATTVPIISAAIPSNKKLNVAASIMGLLQLAEMSAGIAFSFFNAGVSVDIDTELPYHMLTTRNTIRPPSTYYDFSSYSLFLYLKVNLPKLMNAEDYLSLKNYDDIKIVWQTLRFSPFSLNMGCDVGTIFLTSVINDKPIHISLLASFINWRKSMLKKLADISLEGYCYVLKEILTSLSNNIKNEYELTAYKSLAQILSRHRMGVVSGANHIAVVARLPTNSPNMYVMFNFDIEGNVRDNVMNLTQANNFFLTKDGRISFHGFMGFNLPPSTD